MLWLHAGLVVCGVLLGRQRGFVLVHGHFHGRHAQLLEGAHDAQAQLALVELASALVVRELAQPVQIGLNRLFQFIVSNLCVSVFHARSQQNHRVLLILIFLLLFFSVFRLEELVVQIFPCFFLQVFKEIVMITQLQVIQIKGV